MPKIYPCETEPFKCPFDAESSEGCRCNCGIGVDDNDHFYEDLLMEQQEQM